MGFLKPRERLRLALLLEHAGALADLGRAALEGMLGRRLNTDEYDPRRALELAEADRRSLILNDIRCMFYDDPRYPLMLRTIYDPPLVLFCRGVPPADGALSVAVVGTRRPTAGARRAAWDLGRELSRAGVTVVSGLARGIDGDAHRGAVSGGGAHVAVLGNGLARIYPTSNAALGRRILSLGGALLSEYPPDEPPRKHHFPARNRILSGLSRAVVVVQAPAHSGALITADFALEQGREVLVHGSGLGGTAGEGGAALAESGARAVRCAADVLRALGHDSAPAPVAPGSEGIGARLARSLEQELWDVDGPWE